MNKLSSNLKKLLHNGKISENELSRRTGVAQQIINRILSGENKNPKIATLSPLAHYFTVSISQLIGDENIEVKTEINSANLGWQEVPFFDVNLFVNRPVKDILLETKEKLFIDVGLLKQVFAMKMNDDSMEPKFSNGTILIFDADKEPSNGDFVLFQSFDYSIEMRQLFIDKNQRYKKSLNPLHKDYTVSLLSKTLEKVGVLIQSRTDHITC